jgi:origin recognition complex subunit 2
VVVINGYRKGSTLKAILAIMNNIAGLEEVPLRSQSLDDQLIRIYDFFREETNPSLYLIVHNIESPSLRDQKAKQFFMGLALHPRIHIIASVDNLQAGLLWSTSEISTRKHPQTPAGSDIPSSRGFAWLFHDLTTFLPYANEIKGRDITALPSQSLAASGAVAPGQALTEAAMVHILASVTEKAKRLFRLLATRQIASIEEAGEKQQPGIAGLDKYGIQYDLLFNEARKDFLATSDTALRALLGEFMDHEMVKAGGQPEALWIPATKEVIRRALQGLESNQ